MESHDRSNSYNHPPWSAFNRSIQSEYGGVASIKARHPMRSRPQPASRRQRWSASWPARTA
ncbi:hypothetical protein BGLA2_50024 [Burkholderia gladioli]|nr:hypothetical protein BGLA2_50024 [Burkholderia gladioli]